MRIALANDHAGTALKNEIAAWLQSLGHEVVDFGTFDEQLEGRCEIAYLPRTPEIGSVQGRPCRESREDAQEALVR